MAKDISTFHSAGIDVYFLSQRAKIDGHASQHLAQFIQGAKVTVHAPA